MNDQFNLKLLAPKRWNDALKEINYFTEDSECMNILLNFMHEEKKACDEKKLNYGPFAALVAVPYEIIDDNNEIRTLENIDFVSEEKHSIKKVTSWRPVSIACNQVVSTGQAILHGENMAAMLASQYFREHNFARPYDFAHNHCLLATTSAPCEMCLNVIKWLKPKKVVTGATRLDTFEHTCFNEGLDETGLKLLKSTRDQPEKEAWVEELQSWGVKVSSGIMRAQVIETILKAYQGVIYQPD